MLSSCARPHPPLCAAEKPHLLEGEGNYYDILCPGESEPPEEVVPAPPPRGAAPISTLRATATPYVPPATRTGATAQSKDEFVTLSTHLVPPP